jgi:predicted phage-related endonuclease
MWKHPVFPWALCTVDAFAAPRPRNEADRVVEVKTNFSAWDEVPDHYKLQANWQMFVTGLTEVPAEIILLPANKRLKTYTHEYDEDLADAALEAATRFWGWVQDHRPPPIDGHAATASTLAGLYPPDRAGGEVEVDLKVAAAVVELRSLKARLENLTDEKARLENVIKAALGDATEAYYKGGVIATWRSQHRKESTIKASDFRVLRLRGGPE